MTHLAGTRMKLSRANHHINDLHRSATLYLASKAQKLYTTEEGNGDLVHRYHADPEIPNDWAVVIGDAIHNMRASLDYLAWSLVEYNGGSPGRHTCFPIPVGEQPAQAAFVENALRGASAEAKKFAYRLQPSRWLRKLHLLDIVDKHRLILVAAASAQSFGVKFGPARENVLFLNLADSGFPIRNGDEVVRVAKAARRNDSPEMFVRTDICFGSPDGSNALKLADLRLIYDHVKKIVDISDSKLFK